MNILTVNYFLFWFILVPFHAASIIRSARADLRAAKRDRTWRPDAEQGDVTSTSD